MNNIIVSGMGVISPAGFSLQEFWQSLVNCKIAYGPVAAFADDENYRIKIGAKISDLCWCKSVSKDILKKYGKAAAYAACAASYAIQDSGINLSSVDRSRVAVVMGTTMGEIEVEETITAALYGGGTLVPGPAYTKYDPHNIVKAIAEETKAQGYSYLLPTACAAGNYAVSVAKNLIEWNYADVVIAGGVDVFSRVAFSGFQRLLSLTPDLCRPFDKKRTGLVVGEGCGILLLEKENWRKNQKSYGKILGAGLASNAYHMTAPHPKAYGELTAMRKAIADGGEKSSAIDCISAHGTGTKANDKVESYAIKCLFTGHKTPPVSAIKSVLGHSMGAAGALELIASFLMIKENTILPTANFSEFDSECGIDCVPNIPRPAKLKRVLSNAFAFGGQTSSILIGV